jgi:homoserine dehydrogenase
MKKNIILFGHGTVGSAVFDALAANPELDSRAEITRIIVRNPETRKHLSYHGLFSKAEADMFQGADIMIEAMGGDEPAGSYIKEALSRGIPVITANKETMNTHFKVFSDMSRKQRTPVLFEASVMAGVPVIRTLSTHGSLLSVNRIEGIMNGATNFVLTRIMDDSLALDDAMDEARAKGFLEADPTDDIMGFDAMRKLMILAKMVAGPDITESSVLRHGIVFPDDETKATINAHGLVLRQVANMSTDQSGLFLSVMPELLDKDHPLADVRYEENRVRISGRDIDHIMLRGAGAGGSPTAEGIMSDLSLLLDGHPYAITKPFEKHMIADPSKTFMRFALLIDPVLFPKAYRSSMLGNLVLTKEMTYDELKPWLSHIRFLAKVGFDDA